MRANELLEALRRGECDERLRAVYGARGHAAVSSRVASVTEGFCRLLDPSRERELAVFSAPGRTELGGNHTDHQNGWALAASVDMDTLACVARSDQPVIRIYSKGHDPAVVTLGDAGIRLDERSRSAALVRGIAARVEALGFPVGGFDAYTETSVLRGSGLSSSAAFEVLTGQIVNCLFCGGALDAVTLAKIGQYAENVYYGKPCGLLDQLACSVGGVIAVDLADPGEPAVHRCAVDFERAGYALVILDSGANHSELDDAFAAIPREMGEVARRFGAETLRAVDEAAFLRRREELLAALGERPVLRAEHFFAETRRAEEQYRALEAGDFPRFLALVRASGESSETKLQNVAVDRPGGDRLLRVIRAARSLAGPEGAARVHGGGFAGTAQAYVPLARLDAFVSGMEAEFGARCCHLVHIRDAGGVRLI